MRTRRFAIMVLLCASVIAGFASPAATATAEGASAANGPEQHPSWSWPLEGPRVVAVPYRAPAHEYGAGHRGVDLPAVLGSPVLTPAAGVVAFRGTVVDRPLLTIEHPGGYVSTFEPLLSDLSPGDVVAEGDRIGVVDLGGHSRPGDLHLGVRLDGAYINPMLLLGVVPRAVLLPCCDAV